MHPSYLTLGDPFPDGPHFEIVNSQRAYHYASAQGLTWLQECNLCPGIDTVVEGAPYSDPASDGAPWYDPNNVDTAGFCGVIGLDIIGADSSTRTANVTQSMSGGGVVGPLYFGPRTLVVRALAVAVDDCSLAAGLDWLNAQYGKTTDPCAGDTLTYFDCCPCVCANTSAETSDCWANSYAELRDGPTCEHDYWPTTYAQLRDGPSLNQSQTWCSWPKIYRQLREGPPQWSCCVDECITPYFRQLRTSRIVSGPTILETPALNSCGAMALLEFTIVAADPHEHAPLVRATALLSVGGGELLSAPEQTGLTNLFSTPRTSSRTMLLERPSLAAQEWEREEANYDNPGTAHISAMATHLVRLAAIAENTQPVRVGVWVGAQYVTGYYLPYVPYGAVVVIDEQGRRMWAEYEDGRQEPLGAFVRDFDGVSPVRWINGPYLDGRLTVDRTPGDAAELVVEVMVASVGL